MILKPDHNIIEISLITKTCTVTARRPEERIGYLYKSNPIAQKTCLEIMKLAHQAGYAFDISKANTTSVFKDFFATLS